jgi:hypothetical protein
MSALSEASTPAQEAASASIDTQQLQLHNGDPSQQQPGQNGSSASGNDSGRKRPSTSYPVRQGYSLIFFKQQKRRLSDVLAPLVTVAKQDAARSFHARYVIDKP